MFWNKALQCNREYDRNVRKENFIEGLPELIFHGMQSYCSSKKRYCARFSVTSDIKKRFYKSVHEIPMRANTIHGQKSRTGNNGRRVTHSSNLEWYMSSFPKFSCRNLSCPQSPPTTMITWHQHHQHPQQPWKGRISISPPTSSIYSNKVYYFRLGILRSRHFKENTQTPPFHWILLLLSLASLKPAPSRHGYALCLRQLQ